MANEQPIAHGPEEGGEYQAGEGSQVAEDVVSSCMSGIA
jgi:hypothetical protein